jgi:hypothetical protein
MKCSIALRFISRICPLIFMATAAAGQTHTNGGRYIALSDSQIISNVVKQTRITEKLGEGLGITTRPRGLIFRKRHSEEFIQAIRQRILNEPDSGWFSRPTDEGIRRIASKYDLYKKRTYNPHLRYFEGDISFWREHIEQTIASDQGNRTYKIDQLWEVELILLAHWIVMEDAEFEHISIPSKGDWTHAAITVLGEIWYLGQATILESKKQNSGGSNP